MFQQNQVTQPSFTYRLHAASNSPFSNTKEISKCQTRFKAKLSCFTVCYFMNVLSSLGEVDNTFGTEQQSVRLSPAGMLKAL